MKKPINNKIKYEYVNIYIGNKIKYFTSKNEKKRILANAYPQYSIWN